MHLMSLVSLGGTNPFFTPFSRLEDKQKASTEFQRLQQAMEQLGISDKEQKAIWRTVAAIYHLGCAGAAKGTGNKFIIASFQVIYKLLQIYMYLNHFSYEAHYYLI